MRKHPYYMTARDDQREAFIREVERLTRYTPRPITGRILARIAR